MKNSVEKAVKTLKKDTTARVDPETQPPPAQAPPVPGMDMLAGEMTITIMFTDVVGSTPMNQRLGDQQAWQVMHAYDLPRWFEITPRFIVVSRSSPWLMGL